MNGDGLRSTRPRAATSAGGTRLKTAALGLCILAACALGGAFVGRAAGAVACDPAGEPGDFLYGLDCLDNELRGGALGVLPGIALGAVLSYLLLIPAGPRARFASGRRRLILPIALMAALLIPAEAAVAYKLFNRGAPELVDGSAKPVGRGRTLACLHSGIVRLGPCGESSEPEPMQIASVDKNGWFTLRAEEDALPTAAEIDFEAAVALDARSRFQDAALTDVVAALLEGVDVGEGAYGGSFPRHRFRVATVIASRAETGGSGTNTYYCGREIVFGEINDSGYWNDPFGSPINVSLAVTTRCSD